MFLSWLIFRYLLALVKIIWFVGKCLPKFFNQALIFTPTWRDASLWLQINQELEKKIKVLFKYSNNWAVSKYDIKYKYITCTIQQ